MVKSNFSIKDLESLTGIKAHTIRIWEQRYAILKPNRTDTNIRQYSNNDLKRILNVSLLLNEGLKISKIAALSHQEFDKKINYFSNNSQTESLNLKNMLVSAIEMDEKLFHKTFNSSVLNLGMENTFETVLFPLLLKIGNLWQTDAINPAQEHFISNLIRQKLIVAIDGITENISQTTNKILFYLPEGELHELSLLYYSYLAKKLGNQIIYLGQSIPISNISTSVKQLKANLVVTIITQPFKNISTQDYLNEVAKSLSNVKLLVGGLQARNLIHSITKLSHKKVSFFKNSQEFKQHI